MKKIAEKTIQNEIKNEIKNEKISEEKKDILDDEAMISKRERELESNLIPQSDTDFERLIFENPTSSYLYIQWMAFKLSTNEVDQAREIGERALKVYIFPFLVIFLFLENSISGNV